MHSLLMPRRGSRCRAVLPPAATLPLPKPGSVVFCAHKNKPIPPVIMKMVARRRLTKPPRNKGPRKEPKTPRGPCQDSGRVGGKKTQTRTTNNEQRKETRKDHRERKTKKDHKQETNRNNQENRHKQDNKTSTKEKDKKRQN